MPQPVSGQAGSTTPSSGLGLVAHIFLPRGHMEVKGTELNPHALYPAAGLAALAIKGIKRPFFQGGGAAVFCLLGSRILSEAS